MNNLTNEQAVTSGQPQVQPNNVIQSGDMGQGQQVPVQQFQQVPQLQPIQQPQQPLGQVVYPQQAGQAPVSIVDNNDLIVENHKVLNEVVNAMQNTNIANAIQKATVQQPQTQQVDYGNQIGQLTQQVSGLTELINKMSANQQQNNDDSQNNNNSLDSGVQSATINSNDNTFDVNELTNNVTDKVAKQLDAVTQELTNMKVASVKQAFSLSDSDFEFVNNVAKQVGIDVLNDPSGLQSIISAVEQNNKVVIGKQRENNQKTDAQLQMQETGNYLKAIAGGKL